VTELVDTHVHLTSPDTARYPLQPLDTNETWYRDAPCSLERYRELMAEHDVTAAYLVQTMTAYTDDNTYAVDSALSDPARFASVVYVDLAAGDSVATLDGWVERGARGVRVVGDTPHRPVPLDGPAARAVTRHAGALGLHILVTTLAEGLPTLARVLADDPDLTVSLDHCGFADLAGGHPYPAAAPLFALAAFPNVTLKLSTIALDRARRADGDTKPFVDTLVERFGPDRLMWASNYSTTEGRSYESMIDLALGACAHLGAAERTAFLAGTALARWPVTP
jgi:predicted TIM-barrel fold metal-dependent hydrolase